MIILGLHFGHDASVCVVRDGEVVVNLIHERYCRIKYAMSLTRDLIEDALSQAGIGASDIDCCAVCSTQTYELIFDDPDYLKINYEPHPGNVCPSMMVNIIREKKGALELIENHVRDIIYNPEKSDVWVRPFLQKMLPGSGDKTADEFYAMPWLNDYVMTEAWRRGATLDEMRDVDISRLIEESVTRYGFHYPLTVEIAGRSLPGYAIHHHFAHAASSYYQSPFDDAAIITHDGWGGGEGYDSGMFYYGREEVLLPVMPHHLALGSLYDQVGLALDLGSLNPAGKLMGLAAYGKPVFYDHRFVGNWYDWLKFTRSEKPEQNWINHCLTRAKQMGYDVEPYGDRERATAPINADIAASTQKLFEECSLLSSEVLFDVLVKNGVKTENLCITGGHGLNCPSNSRQFQESAFKSVFVEPCCDDSGLAIGSSLCVYHNLYGEKRRKNNMLSPYLGARYHDDDFDAALADYADRISVTPCQDVAVHAAKMLMENKIIGWFEGRSEIGPRALCHRSIIADARNPDNWKRVNLIKRRELWRPFAPVVLEEYFHDWFFYCPEQSRYMLFNAYVKSKDLPAITHRDCSSRVQTATPESGAIYNVLVNFHEGTGVPVLMNTSFNGPSEPIVETPEHALNFLVNSDIDAVYLGDRCIIRK